MLSLLLGICICIAVLCRHLKPVMIFFFVQAGLVLSVFKFVFLRPCQVVYSIAHAFLSSAFKYHLHTIWICQIKLLSNRTS